MLRASQYVIGCRLAGLHDESNTFASPRGVVGKCIMVMGWFIEPQALLQDYEFHLRDDNGRALRALHLSFWLILLTYAQVYKSRM